MTHEIQARFAPSLLSASAEARRHYFDTKIVAHPHLANSFKLALEHIQFAPPGELVTIVGPSGVGTTQLGRKLLTHYGPSPSDDTQRKPEKQACICAVAPSQRGRIDSEYWKRVLKGILVAGNDILVDQKIYVPPEQFVLTHTTPFASSSTMGIDALLRAVANMLNYRGTTALLINQADRFFPEDDKNGSSLSRQMLQDLATLSSARVVLIGNYEMVQSSDAQTDWLRRQNTVHLRRYDHQDESEYADFISTLEELLGHMPSPWRLKTLSAAGTKEIYMREVGRVGTLKNCLATAFRHSLESDGKITESFILRFAQPSVAAGQIARDVVKGERLLLDTDVRAIQRILESGRLASAEPPAATTGMPKTPGASGARACNPVIRRIGERLPTRDPVGDQHEKRA